MIVNRVCCLVLRSPVSVMKRVKCSSVSSPQRLSWSGTSPGTWPGKESESGTSTSNGLWPGPWCIIIHAINFSQWVQFGFGCVYYRNIASLCSWPSLIWGTWNFVPDVLTYVCTWGIRRFRIGPRAHVATWADSNSPDTSSTYICQDIRNKVSRPSDQRWPRAEACNVAILNSAKSELNSLTTLSLHAVISLHAVT